MVITGAPGTGKTSTLRALISATPGAKFGVLPATWANSSNELLMLVLAAFDVYDLPNSKAQRALRLRTRLCELRQQGFAPVLVVDEAHALDTDSLEEIRLLTNFEEGGVRLLTVILAGQRQLAGVLNREKLLSLKQRIGVRIDLSPLALHEVEAYINYRWSYAGGSPDLPFTREAVGLIAKGSQGFPAVINSICENSLRTAQISNDPPVTTGHVREVLRQLNLQVAEAVLPPVTALVPAGRVQGQAQPQTAVVLRRPAQTPGGVTPPFAMRLVSWFRLGTIQWRKPGAAEATGAIGDAPVETLNP